MSNVPRGSTTDENRRLADTARWRVLARLPDVSAEPISGRTAKQSTPDAVEYRFDPPQVSEASLQTATSGRPANRQPPHMFERPRPAGQRGIARRKSSVLPRTNPFSNPRPRLIDSVAPAVRFLTMAALFTAAGIWFQMLGLHAPSARPHEVPKTAAQPPAPPAKNVNDHTVPAPTATGPLERAPEPGARVGRADGDDFASHDQSATETNPPEHPTVTPPHFLVTAGGHIPRVQVSDPHAATDEPVQSETPATTNLSTGEPEGTTESNQTPEMARYPGFKIEIPQR